MHHNKVSTEALLRENQALRKEIDQLRNDQIDQSHLSSIIYERKRTEENFTKINDHLLSLGPSYDENVNLLTRLCGELSGAAYAVYSRFENGTVTTPGRWKTPPYFPSFDNAGGSICEKIFQSEGTQMVSFNNLPGPPDFTLEPNISSIIINSCIGRKVTSLGEPVGTICSFFAADIELSMEHQQIFTIIAAALGNEESRKNSERKLRESEERFRSAFLTSPDSININRLSDGMYVDINEGFTKVTGYTQEDVIGKKSIDLDIWDHPEDRTRLVEGLLRDGYVENLEAQFRIKNGGTKTALMSARLFSIKGEPHILSVTRDMTEWKKAALAMEESEHKFRSVVENAFDGIYLVSGNRFLYCNHRFCEIMGYSSEEIASEEFNFGITLTDKSRDLIERRKQARLRGEKIPGIYEFEIITKTGQIKQVEVSTVPLETQNEVIVLGIMRDITDRKLLFEELVKARDKAEEVNILKSRLLANLSHEIRTPLNGILGFAELLKEEIANPAQKSMADIIYTSGYRLLNTLNAILDLSVIESQFGKLNLRTINLNHMSVEVVDLFKPNTAKKGIDLQFISEFGDINVYADEELVNKILNNLINNAIKFTQKGKITVRTLLNHDGPEVFGCIEVTDTGIGIKPENQKIIFDEFRQVSEGQARHYDGSGLGLHISKRFAEMMGGTITLKSELAAGSTFTVRLPVK